MLFLFKKSKISKLIFLFILSIIIFWKVYNIIIWIKDNNYLLLSQFILTGTRKHTSDADIYRSIASLGKLGNIITQDINLIKKQIENLPWIKQVSISKKWPNKLKIDLIEYMPIAYWNNLHILVDVSGKSFNIPIGSKIKFLQQFMPIFFGPKGTEQQVLSAYYAFNTVLLITENVHKLRITEVIMNSYFSWSIKLNNNIYLKIGQVDIIKKFQFFIEIYPLLLKNIKFHNKFINYIDLRYNSGFAVG